MTAKRIASDAMAGVSELSYRGMVVIDKGDLLQIIREATEKAYQLGHQNGLEKAAKPKPVLTKPVLTKKVGLETRRMYPDCGVGHPYDNL